MKKTTSKKTSTPNPLQGKRDAYMATLEASLKEGDFAGAKKALNDFIKLDLTNEEKGEVYVNAVSAYLSLSNRINRIYMEHLQEAIDSLKKLEVDERQINEEIKKVEIKNKLSMLSASPANTTSSNHDDDDDF